VPGMATEQEGGGGPGETAAARLARVRERIQPAQGVWLDDAVDEAGSVPVAAGASQWETWSRGVRMDLGARGIAALALVGVTVVVVAAVIVFRDRPAVYAVPPLPPTRAAAAPESSRAGDSGTGDSGAGDTPTSVAATPSADAELVVSVVGLVLRPGLLRLSVGSRVADALAAAGGPTAGADMTSLDVAARLADGDQIVVGSAAAAPGPADAPSSVQPGAPSTGRHGAGKGRAAPPAARVSLNTATEQELDALPGVGPSTAAAIVAWRRGNGRFTDLDQLREIHGIGPATFARLRTWVTL